MNYNKAWFRTYEPKKEAVIMSSELKRITFVVSQDMEMRLDEVKLVLMCPAISVETGEQTVYYGSQLTVERGRVVANSVD